MGKGSDPIWTAKVVAKLPSRPAFSATRGARDLVEPRPPYSSGTSTPRRPKLAGLPQELAAQVVVELQELRQSRDDLLDDEVLRGLADHDLLLVKSSGVKTSSGVRSSIRKLPPLAATTPGLGFSGHALVSFSHPFEDPGGAHPAPHDMVTRP